MKVLLLILLLIFIIGVYGNIRYIDQYANDLSYKVFTNYQKGCYNIGKYKCKCDCSHIKNPGGSHYKALFSCNIPPLMKQNSLKISNTALNASIYMYFNRLANKTNSSFIYELLNDVQKC